MPALLLGKHSLRASRARQLSAPNSQSSRGEVQAVGAALAVATSEYIANNIELARQALQSRRQGNTSFGSCLVESKWMDLYAVSYWLRNKFVQAAIQESA